MTLNQKLATNQPVIGSWVSLTDPAVIELLCQTDFDFLLVDGEHAPISEDVLKNVLIAANGFDMPIIYRVRRNDEARLKIALDLGVDGLFVPMVNSATEAQQAVDATRYPPQGKRGIGPWRASNYYQEIDSYMARANQDITLILQIEHVDAVANLDEILAVGGFDVAFIGPADLSASLNLFPQTQHPDVMAQIDIVVQKCAAAGMPVGIDSQTTDHIQTMHKKGIQLFTHGMDVAYIIDGAKQTIASARDALQS